MIEKTECTFSNKPFKEVTLESIKETIDSITPIKPIPFDRIAMNFNAIKQLIEQAGNNSFETVETVYGFAIIESDAMPDGYFSFFYGSELVGILYPDGTYTDVTDKHHNKPEKQNNE